MKKLSLVVFVIVVGAGFSWAYYMKQDVAERYSLSELRSIADGANKSLPLMVDDVTRLEKVSAEEKILEKHYKMISIEKSALDIGKFKSQMTNILVEQSCNNPQSQNLYSSGVSELFTYNDKNGEHILTIKVGMNDCGS